MNEIKEKDVLKENLVFSIRNKLVMIDSDLARIYECTNGTKDINKAVKRNIDRFPEDFYFQLTKEEALAISRFQNGTLKTERGKNIKYLPYAFTQEGVSMLASVLHTKVASEASVSIMRKFVKMRQLILTNLDSYKNIDLIQYKMLKYDKKLDEHDDKINELFDKLEPKFNNRIIFSGQIYDAYSLLLDILESSKKEIIIFDNYIDKKTLDLISKIKTNVIIVSKNMNEELINKYQKQYNNLTIVKKDDIHDRFIIIDRNILYHLGASLKDLGKSLSGINKINDKEYLESIIKQIE